jgi:hypothetical protein
MLSTGKREAPPPPRAQPRRGCPPKKGPLLGSPKPLARKRSGWQPPPPEGGALGHAWEGIWQAVLPGRLLRVGVVRRPAAPRSRPPGQRKPPPPGAAFFTTDLPLRLETILAPYRERWAVEIPLRDRTAFPGCGQAQGRKYTRGGGAKTFRLGLAAARTLWVGAQASRTDALDLTRYRPWYHHKQAPSQLDLVWACREALQAAGVFPRPRFPPGLATIPQKPENALPFAA